MRRYRTPAALVVAGFLVTGCSALSTGGQSLSVIARETALAMIRTVNAMGVDPFQASPQALARWQAACLNLSGLATVWNPAVPGADRDVENTCAVILEAAAKAPPAVPDGMPGGDSDLTAPDAGS